jgi:RND family efflux transporter MFP subunit
MMMNRKKLVVYAVVGVLLAIGAAVTVENTMFSPDKKSSLMNIPETLVKVGHLQEQLIPLDISALAEVKALQEIDLAAQESGYLTAVNIKNGELVKKGDVLFQIDNKDEKSAVLSAKAAFEQAQLHFNRIQSLVKEGAESQDQLDSDRKNLEQAQSQFDQAKKALAQTTVRAPFDGRVTYTDLNIGSYVNIGDKLISIVNDDQRLLQYQLPAKYLKSVELNQDVFFTESGSLVDQDLGQQGADHGADLSQFSNQVSNQGSNQGSNQKPQIFSAQVIYISPEIDSQSNAFTVRALIQDAPKTLEPGFTLMVTQVLDPTRRVLALPGLALLGDPNGFYVFVLNDQDKVLMRRVVVGQQFNSWIEIKSGITPEDTVVLEGQQNIHEGQKVKVVNVVQ